MFGGETRKVALMISLGVALLIICIAVVFVIDAHFSVDPWGDGDVDLLWNCLFACVFFPGALRRYRASRQAEQKVSWYRRLDLIACLIGLVGGLLFVESVAQKWFESVLNSNIDSSHPLPLEGQLLALQIAIFTLVPCWIVLVILFLFQAFKQSIQRSKASPQTT